MNTKDLLNKIHKVPQDTALIFYVSFLLIFGALFLRQPQRILAAFFIIVAVILIDALFSFHKVKKVSVSKSTIIIALVVLSIFDTLTHPYLSIFASVLAIVGKHFFEFKNLRINSVAVSGVLISFFVPIISWWAVSWSSYLIFLTIIAALFIVLKNKSQNIIIGFLLAYVILLAIIGSSFSIILLSLSDGVLFYFIGVLLISSTNNFGSKKEGTLFGVLVACLAIFLPLVFKFLRAMDPLLFALVIGNIILEIRRKTLLKIDNSTSVQQFNENKT